MYDLRPAGLYMLKDLQDNPDAVVRTDRILGALGKTRADVALFDAGNVYDVVRELQAWPPEDPLPGVAVEHRRPLVFTSLKNNASPEGDPLIEGRPEDVPLAHLHQVLGYIDGTRNYHTYWGDAEENMVCWPTRDFGVMNGCSHGCYYCGEGKHGRFLTLGMNIDEFVEQVVGPTIESTPGQRCFRMIGWGADIISFEPEYGVFRSYLTKLAEYEGRYGYFHSNSDNVDWIADDPNRDRLIGVWSLACEGVARQIEPGSPSAADRIEAARKCQEMGIPVRIKLKPTIPIRNWRQEYGALFGALFANVRPETIGFCVIMWMTVEALKQKIPAELLDPDYLRRAEEAAEEMAGVRTGPYPPDVRAEIYRFLIGEVRQWDPDIPVFLSTESREMWDEMADEVGQSPKSFMCGCNPVQVPGPRMKVGEHIPKSTFLTPQER